MPTVQHIAALIQAYADGPRLIEEAIRGMSADELHFKPGPEHWSIHENVIHVVDTDLIAAGRMRFIIAQPGTMLVGMDVGRWAQTMAYPAQPLAEAVELLRAVRASTAALLRRVPPATWEQTGTHTEAGPQTLEWLVEHFVEHIHYHLRTIAKRREQFARAG
ncbi:MAG: DinB family protein [Armatimonadota bacterium]|nr:DinB family protein [Armatimonadota bacterium]